MTQQEEQAVEDAAANQNTYVESEVVDAFIAGAQFLDNLRKPIEPETNVGEAGEELVSEIDAALMQPDKELLEALKRIQKYTYDASSSYRDICDIAIEAISNYEKQCK